jgi:hypothetical protein
MPGRGGVLTGAWPLDIPECGSSLARAQKSEGSTGNPSWASPGLRRCCGDWATTEKRRLRGNSVVVVLELRRRGKVRGECAMNGYGGHLLL